MDLLEIARFDVRAADEPRRLRRRRRRSDEARESLTDLADDRPMIDRAAATTSISGAR